MSENEFSPLYHTPGIQNDAGWQFMALDGEIQISNHGRIIEDILARSDGRHGIQSVVESVVSQEADQQLVERVAKHLRALGVIIDSREQYRTFHDLTTNPARYNWPHSIADVVRITDNDPFQPRTGTIFPTESVASSVIELSGNRESCREFAEKPVPASLLGTCLDGAYASEIHPIPSAGGLYPLRMYMVVKDQASDIPAGYYQYNHMNQTLIQFNNEVDDANLQLIFNDERTLHGAPVLFVIAADIDRHPSKYANRGYRYTMLEAGHAAQNIHLVAEELGLASLEYGGFVDAKLEAELQLPPNEKALITIALGYEGEPEQSTTPLQTLAKLEQYIGENKPIEWVRVDQFSKLAQSIPFYHAAAKYRPSNEAYDDTAELFSSGTARSMDVARIKAIVEAYERYIAGVYCFDVVAAANELTEPWISPHDIRPLTDEQYLNQQHLEQFKLDKPIEWVYGEQADGNAILVPVELIYYPLSREVIGRKRAADADSSGMAAYTNRPEASKRAMLELIERDALMRSWFSHEPPQKISGELLPKELQKRREFWLSQGKEIDVLDLSHDGIAILSVIIHSPDGSYPYFVSGAAASIDSFERAVSKAFQEAELGFTNAQLANMRADWVEPQNVISPEDHGRFYYYDYFADQVSWLWSGPSNATIPEVNPKLDLIKKYDATTVWLTDPDDDIQVVRMLSRQLVPINFGFGNEYFSHPAVGLTSYNPVAPHHFA